MKFLYKCFPWFGLVDGLVFGLFFFCNSLHGKHSFGPTGEAMNLTNSWPVGSRIGEI